MAKRPPRRVTVTKVIDYGVGGRHRSKKVWSWWLLGAGVLAVILFFKTPMFSLLIFTGVFWYWRSQNGRRR